MEGHYARNCSYPKQKKENVEAWGKKKPAITSLREAEGSSKEEIEQLRQRLRELEMEAALKRMSSIEGDDQNGREDEKGPYSLRGRGSEWGEDNCSSRYRVSGHYHLTGLRDADPGKPETPQYSYRAMAETDLQRLLAPDVALKSYGGHRVDIVSQTSLQLTLGEKQIDACAEGGSKQPTVGN